MTLQEISTVFQAEGLNKIAFLLDATTLTDQMQSDVIVLVSQVLFQLPATIKRSVYFFGNPTPYRAMFFDRQAAKWFQDNRQRASLITPILEALQPNDISDLVILGAEQIFDLGDWRGSPFLGHMKEICLSNNSPGHSLIQKRIVRPNAQSLCLDLHDPVVGIEIGGPGFMPIFWNHIGYTLQINDGQAQLHAKGLDDYSIHLKAFVRESEQLEIIITRASGAQIYAPLLQASSSADAPAKEGVLTPKEQKVFRLASQKQAYPCVICGKTHSWNQLYCDDDRSILGKLVYPSLASDQRRGFVVFKKVERKTKYQFIGGDVFRLRNDRVAIRQGNKAQVYQYNERQGIWTQSGETLELYHLLEGGSYVIFL